MAKMINLLRSYGVFIVANELGRKALRNEFVTSCQKSFQKFCGLEKPIILKINPTIAKILLKFDFTLMISLYFLIFSHSGPQTVVCFEPNNCRFPVDPPFFVLLPAIKAFLACYMIKTIVAYLEGRIFSSQLELLKYFLNCSNWLDKSRPYKKPLLF